MKRLHIAVAAAVTLLAAAVWYLRWVAAADESWIREVSG